MSGDGVNSVWSGWMAMDVDSAFGEFKVNKQVDSLHVIDVALQVLHFEQWCRH